MPPIAPPEPEDRVPPPVCSMCGTVALNAYALGWTMDMTIRGVSHICPDCTRMNTRAIEGKLDQDWW